MIQQEINLYEEPKPVVKPPVQYTGGVTIPWTQNSIDAAIRSAIANGFGIGAQFHYHTSGNVLEVVRFVTDPKVTKTFAGGPAILECKYLNGSSLGLTYYSLPEVLRKDTFILSKKSPLDKEETNEQEDCN